MKNLILALLAFLGLAACAPASKNIATPPDTRKHDFTCVATDANGVKFTFRYYKHVVDATAYNMGMRNFVMVEAQVDDRFNSIDINEDGNTLEPQRAYYEKLIHVNTIRGVYKIKTNYYANGGVDSAIEVELLGVPVVLTSMSCE